MEKSNNPISYSLCIDETIHRIKPLTHDWLDLAVSRQLKLTKPPGSLGVLEDIANRLVAIRQTLTPIVSRKRIYVVAADHGVVVEGVSAYPREVTAQMVCNFLRGGAAINVMARNGGIEVSVVDAGVDADLDDAPDLIRSKIVRGTANFTQGSAMTRDEAIQSIEAGIRLAQAAARDGIELLGIGEMGIGNSTAASAIAATLTGLDAEVVTGYGTGVDEAGLQRKIEAVRRAIEINKPEASDALDVLAKVGGAEIGVMAGIVLGAAAERIPIVADGFISTSAAAVAYVFSPYVRDFLFIGHRSQEQGHALLIKFIDSPPLLNLQMRLGEGTGAALAMHIIDTAAKLLNEMATFNEAGVSDRGE